MKALSTVFRSRLIAWLPLLAALVLCPAAWAQTNPLLLTVRATPDPVRPGENIEYVFTASNTGTTILNNVSVQYLVPNNTKGENYYTAGTSRSLGFGNIPPGQSSTVATFVTVNAANASTGALAPPDGTVITLSAVASNSSFSITASVEAKVAANPAFSIAIAADEPNFAAPGAVLNYTIRYGNTGPASGGSTLRVPLPAGTTVVSASDGGALGSDGVVQWNIGALATGQSGLRKLSVSVNASLAAGTVLATLAEVRDTANGSNSARAGASVIVRASTALTLTVRATPDAVKPGQTINYSFTVTNRTATAQTGVSLYYLVPNNTKGDNYYGPGTSRSIGFSNIPPGQSSTANASVTVNAANASTGALAPPDGTIIRMNASVSSSTYFSAAASVDVTVNAQPAFSVDIASDDSTAAAPGAVLNYTIRYGNTGPASGGSTLRVPLPAGTTVVSASDGGALGSDGVVQWNIGALATGQSGLRKLSVSVNASLAAGTVLATLAEVRDAANGISLARSATVDVVRTLVLLSLSVAAAPDTVVLPGGTINYTFTATNRSTTALNSVEVDYRVPAYTKGDNYYGPGTNRSLGFGNIPPNQSRTVTTSVTVDAANASTGALAPPNGTLVHLDIVAASNSGFSADASNDVTVNANTHPSYFTGETALNNGVYYLSFPNGNYFGYYSYLTDPHYIYHFDLGYEYLFDAADGKGGVYFYDFKSGGFFYSSPLFPFPYLYDFTLNTVLYYYPDPSNPGRYNTNGYRFFYRFDNGQIIVK